MKAVLLTSSATLSFIETPVVLEGFKRVHASNMSKLDENGKVVRREDGKVMKSDQYRAPDMTGLFSPQGMVEHVNKVLEV